MASILNLFWIAFALSMDTFSLSIAFGSYDLNKSKCFFLALLTGFMHFFMPIIGLFIGTQLLKIFPFSVSLVAGVIFLLLSIDIMLSLIKKEQLKFKTNFLGLFIFAITVSIDSFSIGIGLNALTNYPLIALIIFSITSFSFTLLGLFISKKVISKLGIYAKIMGCLLLFLLSIKYIFFM